MSLKTIQVGMNTADLAGTLLLYSEAFGFRNTGGNVLARSVIPVQGLDEEARAIIWWMIGGQPLFQLEFFNHTQPAQRPLRKDWSVIDHGWGRIGIGVADFDRALLSLRRAGAEPIAGVVSVEGSRRAAVRDPYVGVILEIVEDGPAIRRQIGDLQPPVVVYAAASVSNLDAARVFYRDQIGLDLSDLDEPPEHERLWGLADAERRGFVARAPGGGPDIKIIEYAKPTGRPRPADYRASDQGLVNVAFGSNQKADAVAVWDRLKAVGYSAPMFVENDLIFAGYVVDPEREVEIATLADEYASFLGLEPKGPFLVAL